MSDNFIWTDDKVMEFARKFLTDRASWAITHDFAAAPEPIELELQKFKETQKSWKVHTVHDNGGFRGPKKGETDISNSAIFAVQRIGDGVIFKKDDRITYTHNLEKDKDVPIWTIGYFTQKNGEIFVNQHHVEGTFNSIETWVKLHIL